MMYVKIFMVYKNHFTPMRRSSSIVNIFSYTQVIHYIFVRLLEPFHFLLQAQQIDCIAMKRLIKSKNQRETILAKYENHKCKIRFLH